MDVKLRIPDELADEYLKRAGAEAAPDTLPALLLAQLVKFRALGPQDRAIVLAATDREALEQFLGPGHLRSSADLREKVERLARLHVGDIRIPFTVGEWQEIVRRAEKLRLTPEQECQRIVKTMHDTFFNY